MTNTKEPPYGFCPICGKPGKSRERRPNGNDTCEGGCVYPSSNAVTEPNNKVQYPCHVQLTDVEEVTAFKDNSGNIWQNKNDCIRANFRIKIEKDVFSFTTYGKLEVGEVVEYIMGIVDGILTTREIKDSFELGSKPIRRCNNCGQIFGTGTGCGYCRKRLVWKGF